MASAVYIGKAQGEEGKKTKQNKKHKKGAKIEQGWGGFFFSPHVFWISPPSCLKDAFSFACQIKLNCNMEL